MNKKTKKSPAKRLGRPSNKAREAAAKAEGFELLKIEHGLTPPRRQVTTDPMFPKLLEQMQKMKIGDAMIIKKQWRHWPVLINNDKQLGFKLRYFKIPDTELVRIFRTV